MKIGRLNGMRSISSILRDGRPEPDASMSRFWSSKANQRMMELAMEILGPYFQVDRGSPQSIAAETFPTPFFATVGPGGSGHFKRGQQRAKEGMMRENAQSIAYYAAYAMSGD